jgi:hypothetical protein
MNYDKLISTQIYEQNKLSTSGYNIQPDTSSPDSHGVDYFFQQESPYKYPLLIICDDSKRINQSAGVIQKYMDVITDECGNRFNIRNLNSSAGVMQAGYSANIDLDSHLKNINYYTDLCYYDNWKLDPNSKIPSCNGVKRNAQILVPDYSAVGRHYKDCLGSNTAPNMCWNTPPTDFNIDSPDVRQRYDFGKSYNKFQTPNCLPERQRQMFPKGEAPPLESLQQVPGYGRSEEHLLNSINRGVQHDFYKFFDETKCVVYPNQRLFNNITKRSMLPNAHFRNSDPIYTL